jgi:hypothetical protein
VLPFVKVRIKRFIEGLGGVLVDSFGEAFESNGFTVTNREFE